MCGQRAQTHSLYPPDDYTSFKSNNLDSSLLLPLSFSIDVHSFALSLSNQASSLASFPSFYYRLPSFPLAPSVLSTFPSTLSVPVLLIPPLFCGRTLYIKALSFPNTDLSITKLHLHTYCCRTPCAKYSFVKPSPIRGLHLVEIVFFQLQGSAFYTSRAGMAQAAHSCSPP